MVRRMQYGKNDMKFGIFYLWIYRRRVNFLSSVLRKICSVEVHFIIDSCKKSDLCF